jgi:hypothetical protein
MPLMMLKENRRSCTARGKERGRGDFMTGTFHKFTDAKMRRFINYSQSHMEIHNLTISHVHNQTQSTHKIDGLDINIIPRVATVQYRNIVP